MSRITGKNIRMSQILDPRNNLSLILEVDKGSMLGPVKGVENLERRLIDVRRLIDGLIVSPGQVPRLINVFKGREAPSLIVRVDWTNAFRNENFILPQKKLQYTLSYDAESAIPLGAQGLAAYYIVGYERDEDEAKNMEAISLMARESGEFGVPLIIQSLPLGGRVTKENYLDCAKLGVRQSVEAGGDMISTPYVGDSESFRQLIEIANTPVLVNEEGSDKSILNILANALEAGANGVILGMPTLACEDFNKRISAVSKLIHE